MNHPNPIFKLFLLALVAMAIACGTDADKFRKTESNDILLDPPLIERDDGQLRAEMTFERLNRPRQTSKALTIRQSGVTDLIVSRVYIEGAEDCDLIKEGLRAGDRLPGELDETCQLLIADGPVKSDGTPHYVTTDDPLILGPDNFVTYTVKYKATQDTPPAAAILVIESNVLGKERVEVELKVLTGQPQIAVTPNTIGFESGMAGDTLLNVRNSGTGQLTVRDVFVRRVTPAPVDGTGLPLVEFRLSATGTPPLPWQIEENQGQAVRVEYEPLDDGGDTAELVFVSDDPNNPEFAVLMTSGDLVSELRIQPNPVIFPARNGSEPAIARISFTNSGLKDLAINQITVEQPAQDYRLGNQQTSFQLRGGQTRTLDVTYQPETVDGSDATLVIATNADNVPGGQFTLPLRASADDVVAIDMSPLVLDFSNTAGGAQTTLDINVSNPGGLPLDISRIALTTAGNTDFGPSDPEFTITSGGNPVTLQPGSNHIVSVTFSRAADDINQHQGVVLIESNANTSPDIVRLVAGPPQ